MKELESTKVNESTSPDCGKPVVSGSMIDKVPTMEFYGFYSPQYQEEEGGWMYEGGEDAYYEALKKWEARQ